MPWRGLHRSPRTCPGDHDQVPVPGHPVLPGHRCSPFRRGPRSHAPRTCCNHLAGRLGVAVMAALLDRGLLAGADGHHHPDTAGTDRLSAPDGTSPTGSPRTGAASWPPSVSTSPPWAGSGRRSATAWTGPNSAITALTTRLLDLDRIRRTRSAAPSSSPNPGGEACTTAWAMDDIGVPGGAGRLGLVGSGLSHAAPVAGSFLRPRPERGERSAWKSRRTSETTVLDASRRASVMVKDHPAERRLGRGPVCIVDDVRTGTEA